jgi:hypothetical protein
MRRLAALVLVALGIGCAAGRPLHFYDGFELPRSETALVTVQSDDNLVKLRIEAVDGMRLPGAEREFHERDREVILRPGKHSLEVRGWGIRSVGPDIELPSGVRGSEVLVISFEPQRLDFVAAAGRDYEVRVRRVPFDPSSDDVAAPLHRAAAEQWSFDIVELPACQACPGTDVKD